MEQYNYVYEIIEKTKIMVDYISTDDMVVNVLTNGTLQKKFGG